MIVDTSFVLDVIDDVEPVIWKERELETEGVPRVIVRAVEEGLPEADATAIVRRVDEHGLHMTGELRETAHDLIEAAAE